MEPHTHVMVCYILGTFMCFERTYSMQPRSVRFSQADPLSEAGRSHLYTNDKGRGWSLALMMRKEECLVYADA